MHKKRLIVSGVVLLIAVCVFIFIYLPAEYVLPILMYHKIDYDWAETKLSVSPESFKRQMEFFHKRNYNVVSLEEAAELIKQGKCPRKTVAITFDDGYKNNFTFAYPVLKKYNFPATIFVVINSTNDKRFLSYDDMRTMLKASRVDIGSHTLSHAWLPGLDDEGLEKEIIDSKIILERRLNHEVKFISYPLGAHNDKAKEIVKQAGYLGACATNPGKKSSPADVYALKRIRISRTSDNLITFWIETSGFYTWIKEIRDED